jgi:hypothetical protein
MFGPVSLAVDFVKRFRLMLKLKFQARLNLSKLNHADTVDRRTLSEMEYAIIIQAISKFIHVETVTDTSH